MACRDCGSELVQTAPQTMSSPAEHECPVCDGGMSKEEIARLAWLSDTDTIGDAKYHEAKDEGLL